MEIIYKTNKLKNICTNYSIAVKNYGSEMAVKIHHCIDQIAAADNVELLVQYRICRCHPLSQNRKGQYAMDLAHPFRLIFEKEGDTIQIAKIIEIVDYH